MMKPIWKSKGCLRCVACVGSCPTGALTYTSGRITIRNNDCIGCGTCIRICPVGCFSEGGDRS